jgi:hypothetical protein
LDALKQRGVTLPIDERLLTVMAMNSAIRDEFSGSL